MADLAKQTLAANAELALAGLTEHGSVKIGVTGNSKIRVEHELHDTGPVRGPVYEGFGPAIVADYVGTKLWITNIGSATLNLRVGQG